MAGRKMLVLLMAAVVSLVLAGCGGGSSSPVGSTGGGSTTVGTPISALTGTGSTAGVATAVDAGGNPTANWVAAPPLWVVSNAERATTVAYTPSQIRSAYGIAAYSTSSGMTGAGQTIAIVDAYGCPTLQNDFNVFCKQYGLPTQTLGVAYPTGKPTTTDAGWAMETNLDVQWAHAVAPGATIVVVVAKSASYTDLLAAVDYAVALKASVVSMSWGGSEFSTETASTVESHFQKAGVTFIAASGDNGKGTMWPSVSPYVLAVGGTKVTLTASNTVSSEIGWTGSGGGQSVYEKEPAYQVTSTLAHPVAAGKRAVPDVAYDADPSTGFMVYDTTPINGSKGWFVVGGTSAGAPQWAGLVALANQKRISLKKTALAGNAAAAIYKTTGCFRDILTGSNGYLAKVGFDLVTGLGAPLSDKLLPALVNY